MRSGHASGRADKAEAVAGGDTVALVDLERREVRQHREHTEAVIDDHRVAREIERPGNDHETGVRGEDWGAGRTEKIGAAVCVARLTVEHAARAERAVGRLRYRPNERTVP